MSVNKKREKISGKERLSKREDFQRLFQHGSRYYSKQYEVIVVQNDLNYVRFAFSMSKKVGNAVIRNYEKRVCREFIRREKDVCRKGHDILIVIKHQTKDFHESYNSLKILFERCFI